MNDVLYSPWRLQYILGEKEKGCIFCIKPEQNKDQDHLILYRNSLSYVIMNLYPYNNAHLMAVPYRHVSNLNELNTEEITDLFLTVRLCERVLKRVYRCEGINVGINLGKAAGAGIEDHLHVHLVPRWLGDCNFMTVTGGTRIIPESFESAYSKLKEVFDNEPVQK